MSGKSPHEADTRTVITVVLVSGADGRSAPRRSVRGCASPAPRAVLFYTLFRTVHAPYSALTRPAGGHSRSGKSGRDEMTKLGRPHVTQDLDGTELDQASIPRRERVPACQQGENGFAGTDKIRSLIPNRKHGVPSLRTGTQGVGEGVCSLTAPPEKSYRTCLVRSFYTIWCRARSCCRR
jgi:hypothetical protein